MRLTPSFHAGSFHEHAGTILHHHVLRDVVLFFFSEVIFARRFARTVNPGSVLDANLMGAVVGGPCEYSSIAPGLRNLYLIAMAIYRRSFLLEIGPSFRGVRVVPGFRPRDALTRS